MRYHRSTIGSIQPPGAPLFQARPWRQWWMSRVVRRRYAFSYMNTYLETRWGGGPANPTRDELCAALAELSISDPDHPCTFLVDDDEWHVDVYETGLVRIDHIGTNICERQGVSKEESLELWLLLQQGRRDEIIQRLSRAEPK